MPLGNNLTEGKIDGAEEKVLWDAVLAHRSENSISGTGSSSF